MKAMMSVQVRRRGRRAAPPQVPSVGWFVLVLKWEMWLWRKGVVSAAPVPSTDAEFVFCISICPGLDHVPSASVPVLSISERNKGRIAYMVFGVFVKVL